MKKIVIIMMIIALLMMVACNNEASVDIEGTESKKGLATVTNVETSIPSSKENQGVEQEVEVEQIAEIETNSGELIFSESVSMSPSISVNEEKVQKAIDMGFPSPSTELDIYKYVPKSSDVIQYQSQENSFELGESLSHKGFEGVEIAYEKTQYTWNDFFGDLSVSEYGRNITVNLKGNNIYEADIVDENEKYYRYYDENDGLHYEVSDLMLGNYMDENAKLVNMKTGNVCNYHSIEELTAPSYNPLSMQVGEEALSYFITVLDEKPCVYVESLYNGKLYKRWIDIEVGLVVKELVFDYEGLLISKKVAISIELKDIEVQLFEQPSDIDYKDITMFLYSYGGGEFETLGTAIMASIPSQETGILLVSDQGASKTIYTSGLDEMQLGNAIYYSKITSDSGEVRTIRMFKTDRFYTVCDELETVEIYDKSCYEKKFFNFEEVGLLNVTLTDNGKTYSFYDLNNISVSALYGVYEYVIENNELTRINYYDIVSIKDNEAQGDIISYEISLIDYDSNIYDESYMKTYKIIDRGEGSFDDGEYVPFWHE